MTRRNRSSRKRKGLGAAGTLLLLFLVLLGVAGAAAWLVFTPFGPETETFVDVAPGSSSMRIARQLELAGVVRSQFAFDLVRLWKRGTLRAGEYRFDHPVTVPEVYARIAHGDVYTLAVTIPEGASIFDIAARLEQDGFGSQQDFLDAQAREAILVADIDPGAKSLEGYLFPDTYRFDRHTTPAEICAAMVRRFKVEAAQLGLKENVHEVVTLASLVERETAVDAERPLVASVFENRLAKNMPLMTDPSVVYGLELEGQWRGTLYESDLKRDTPYNTYLHTGLPPGPVANPGLRSLRAAMHPAQTDYLYFVAAGANPQGRSLFASTLDEHNRNVAGYRHAIKKAGSQ
ncbi:MAG TPA: endolytic transglycosylase MltG [Terracidiphilus sp.]|nr:endolytic transglycosylase MltG [Terracidiphilus sp.]